MIANGGIVGRADWIMSLWSISGQLWMCRAFLPRMLKVEQSSIVSMAALAGYGGVPHMLPFTASKHGVKGFMEGLYVELR